ncbi:SDR family NAD(P)-dependent oxidoreductase [Arcobacter sp. FWKO B]|uniref:SDR family NAD(P)-dependent oxidoreductase n=1 Tax=Arcobacter sp. FWKO B TaxID=2593672 RepID=UPI0018A4222B|nr:SDR family NAD(P)-dependent oxidoreductase [Arcobacter sp. FWKO B]QOG11692.1 SDR family NAD(P)-dependent oxidoreductase [Arcobacter sp. FWKO B]
MEDKKYVLITGCSYGGIGYESARFLQNKGYIVIATARKKEDVKKLKEDGFISFRLDVNDQKSIDKAFKKIFLLTHSKLYAVFNNAGYGQIGALEDLSTEILKEQFETNLFGTHRVLKKVLPIMRSQGYGKIIQHSSILGLVSLRFRGAYQASKYALEGYSDTLRLELNGSGISVSVLNTGPVESNFRANAIKKFYENVDSSKSIFKDIYQEKIEKRKKSSFTLPSSSVAKVVYEILNENNPKPRYYITKASYILAYAKRVLSTKLNDKLWRKISDNE